jgi:uncharacterized protein (TIGR03067 family)
LKKTFQFDCRIDPTSSPKGIDLYRRPGGNSTPPSSFPVEGCYAMDGDQLKICLTRRTEPTATVPRPKELTAKPDSAEILFVLERERLSGDPKALQGIWPVTGWLDDGQPVADEKMSRTICVFDGPAITITDCVGEGQYDDMLTGFFVLDSAESPKAITISTHHDHNVYLPDKREVPGIYQLDGARLAIAYRKNGPRPEAFESKPGSGITLLLFDLSKRKTKARKNILNRDSSEE